MDTKIVDLSAFDKHYQTPDAFLIRTSKKFDNFLDKQTGFTVSMVAVFFLLLIATLSLTIVFLSDMNLLSSLLACGTIGFSSIMMYALSNDDGYTKVAKKLSNTNKNRKNIIKNQSSQFLIGTSDRIDSCYSYKINEDVQETPEKEMEVCLNGVICHHTPDKGWYVYDKEATSLLVDTESVGWQEELLVWKVDFENKLKAACDKLNQVITDEEDAKKNKEYKKEEILYLLRGL